MSSLVLRRLVLLHAIHFSPQVAKISSDGRLLPIELIREAVYDRPYGALTDQHLPAAAATATGHQAGCMRLVPQ